MATIASIAAVAATALSTGSSVSDAIISPEYNVAFKAEIENYTDSFLHTPAVEVSGGHIVQPPVPIKPGAKEAMSGHKSGNTATGCSGVVKWEIGDTGKMLAVMYSIPYSHDYHSNWLGVGIFPANSTQWAEFDRMYYKEEKHFERKEFYELFNQVGYDDENFSVNATMGTGHKPGIQVQLLPKDSENFAPSLKGAISASDISSI